MFGSEEILTSILIVLAETVLATKKRTHVKDMTKSVQLCKKPQGSTKF